jgi:hypothetical protein
VANGFKVLLQAVLRYDHLRSTRAVVNGNH